MITILRIFKKLFKYTLILFIISFLIIRIPIVKNKIGQFILEKINTNKSYKINIEEFNLRQLTTLELKNITIITKQKQSNTISIEEVSFSINPINFLLNKKILLKNIQLSNLKIELKDEDTKNKSNFNNVIKNIKVKLKSIFSNKNIIFKNLKINNLNIIYIKNNTKTENILNAEIKKLDISRKTIFIDVKNISLKNKFLTIFNSTFNLNYYTNSDSAHINITKLSSSLFHFIGGILIKNITSLPEKDNYLKDLFIHTKIQKLILPIENIKKIIDNDLIKNINKNIGINGEVKLYDGNLDIKNFLISYKEDNIILNSQIKNIYNKNTFKYNIQLINCKNLIEIINDYSTKYITHGIKNEYINNVNISINGTNNQSVFYSNIDTIIGNINLNAEAKTNIFDNKNIKNKIKQIKVNLNSKKINHKSLSNIALHDINISFSYDITTEENNIDLIIKKISFKNNTVCDINYSGKMKNRIITGDIKGKSNIISFAVKNIINTKTSDFNFNGNLSILNRKINDLEINSINSDILININKTPYGFKINNLLKNIKIFMNNSEIKTDDIECLITTSTGSLDLNLKTNTTNIKIKDLNPKHLYYDISSLYHNITKDKKNIFKKNHKYKTEITIEFNKSPIFDLFFNKYIDINKMKLYFFIGRRENELENKIILDGENIFLYEKNIENIEFKHNTIFSNVDNFKSDIFLKTIINKKTYIYKSTHNSTNEIINNIIKLTTSNSNTVNANFTFEKDKNRYKLVLDDIKNYIKINNNEINTTGIINLTKNKIIFDNFKITNIKTKKNIISIDLNIYNKILDKDNKFNILINNLEFRNIKIGKFKNINFNLSSKIYDIKDKVTLDIDIKDIKIKKKNYENLNFNLSVFKNNIEIKDIIYINLKYYNKIKTNLNLLGQIFLNKDTGYVLDLKLDDFDLTKINILTKNVVKLKKGTVSANFNLYGDLKKIKINGNGNVKDMSLYICDIGCLLEDINANLFASGNNKIEIFSISSSQNKKKCGDFVGEISFESYFNPHFTISGNFYNCNIFNKNIKNETLNGTLSGNGNIKLEYYLSNLLVDTSIKLTTGELHISPQTDNSQYQIFKKKLDIFKLFYKINTSEKTKLNLSISLDIEKNVDILFNINKFNQLKLNGNGNLIIQKNNNLTITGDYTITQGTYNFNTYNIITKKFHINKGHIIFNNEISNTTINIDAISDKYTFVDNKIKKNSYLGINLKGYLLHPEIEYYVILENEEINKYESKNVGLLIDYFFSNNTNNITLNETITAAINKIIIKNIKKINKNLLISFKSNVLELLMKKEISDICFNLIYNVNNNFMIEKTFFFDNYKNLYSNIELTFHTNNNEFKDHITLFNSNLNKNKNKNKTVLNNIFSNYLTFSHSF